VFADEFVDHACLRLPLARFGPLFPIRNDGLNLAGGFIVD
jgi:hypothetical protein